MAAVIPGSRWEPRNQGRMVKKSAAKADSPMPGKVERATAYWCAKAVLAGPPMLLALTLTKRLMLSSDVIPILSTLYICVLRNAPPLAC